MQENEGNTSRSRKASQPKFRRCAGCARSCCVYCPRRFRKFEGTSSQSTSAHRLTGLVDDDVARLQRAHASMQHLEQKQQLARASSMTVVVVLNVLCAGSQPAEAARALAPVLPPYDAHRQRSCGIAGRTCDLCDRHCSQWPGGRPCIGNSRLTTGDGIVRLAAARLPRASVPRL